MKAKRKSHKLAYEIMSEAGDGAKRDRRIIAGLTKALSEIMGDAYGMRFRFNVCEDPPLISIIPDLDFEDAPILRAVLRSAV